MIRVFIFILLLISTLRADSVNQVFSDFTTPLPVNHGDTLVLGIVGGWERWDAPQRIVRRVALRIREKRWPGVFVETVENHKLPLAEELIRRAFPDPRRASLVIYGNSLGGAAALRFAQRLNELGYTIRFLGVIDAVRSDDDRVPPNVLAAANIFQRDSWPVVGARSIQASDPERTRILGNHRFSYWGKSIDTETEPWVRRVFTRGHLMLEYDPEVWQLLENYIGAAIAPSS